MKRCAMCNKEYADDYDGCPHCAKKKQPAKAGGAFGAIVLLLLCGILYSCSSSGSSVKDNAALASQVESKLGEAGYSSMIHNATADSDNKVIVTLNVAKEDLGSDVQARDSARMIAGTVFSRLPNVKQVSVFDGNNKMIDIYTPQ